MACADPEGGQGVQTTPLKKNIGFPSKTGPDPLKNHKTTKPTFNVGPSSACQRNAIKMAFRWRADDGPLLVLFGSSLSLHKKNVRFGPLSQNFLDPRMCGHAACNIYLDFLSVLSYQIICARYSVKTLKEPSQFYYFLVVTFNIRHEI